MKTHLLLAGGLAISAFSANARINELGTSESSGVIKTLPTAGMKLLNPSFTGFTLLNLDLSPYLTVTYPEIPGYHTHGSAMYITEDLFDTDPTTIEYALLIREAGSNLNNTAVIRTDGTVLFIAQFQHLLFEPGTAFEPIFNTPQGTRMILYGATDGMGTNYPGHIYSLPGSLPCVACDGSVSSLGMISSTDDRVAPNAGLNAFPNPATNEATIRYELPDGTARATLIVSTLSGSIVSRLPITNSGSRTITTADLAAGTYLYHLETDQGVIGAKRLVVVK